MKRVTNFILHHKNKALFLGVALLIFSLIIVLEIINQRFWLNDFKVYYLASKAFINGEQVYGVSFGLDSGFYKYSPFVLILYAPLTFLPYKIAAILHFISIAMATMASVLIINYLISLTIFKIKNNTGKGILYIALLIIINHLVRELHLGNVNMHIVLLLSLGMYFILKLKPVYAGIFIALAILIKPYLLVLTIPLLYKKHKSILYIGLSAFIMLLIPLLILGYSNFLDFNFAWLQSMLEHGSYLNSNHNFTSLIKYYFYNTFPNSYHLHFLFIVLILYTALYFTIIKNKQYVSIETENTYLLISCFVILAILPNILITDTEHFLFSLPLILFLLHYLALHKSIILTMVFIVLVVFYGGNSSDLFGNVLSNKFEQMGLLGLANLGIIFFTIYTLIILQKEQNA